MKGGMKMNYDDIKDYITKQFENRRVLRVVSQDEEPVKYVKSIFRLRGDWRECEKELFEKYNKKYILGSISYSGSDYDNARVTLKENHYDGTVCQINYKGLEYWFDTLKNGQVVKTSLLYRTQDYNSYGGSSTIDIECESLEECYEKSMEIIKKDKREVMNYYNKEIKDIKQEYKKKLKHINDLLKGDKQ